MSGLGFTIQKGDSVEAVVNRVALAFVVHYAVIHQSAFANRTDQAPSALVILGLIAFLYYGESEITKITDPGLPGLKWFLTYTLAFTQTYLHYLLLSITDSLLADTVVDGPLSLIVLHRPVTLMIAAAGLLALLKIYFGQENPKKQ